MKTTTILTFVILFMPWPQEGFAQLEEAIQHFDQGNQRYAGGDYRGAIESYEAALSAGYASGMLYTNLGNSFYRIDEIGQAILWYRRAERLMPAHEELAHNLQLAQLRAVDRVTPLPEPFYVPTWQKAVRTFGPAGFFLVGLILYVVAATLWIKRVLSNDTSDWLRRGILALSILAVPFIAAGFIASYQTASSDEAVVLASEVRIYAEADASSAVETSVHEGLDIEVLSADSAWSLIRLPNGLTGWVESDAYQRL